MKKIYRLLCIAAVMSVAFACKSVPEEGSLEELSAKVEKGVHCYLPAIEFDTPETKVIDIGDKFTATFDENDKIGVWPYENEYGQYQTYTLDINTDNTANARFEGGAFVIAEGSTYTSIYPRLWTDEWPDVPISFEGQIQTGNGTTAHLKNYLYAWASATCVNGSTTFNYEYNAGFIQFVLTFNNLETATSFKEVKLIADSNVFAVNPTLNVREGNLSKGTLTSEISIALKNLSVEPGGTMTVNMAAAPFASCKVRVNAIADDNTVYTSTSGTISALNPGKAKRLSLGMAEMGSEQLIDASLEANEVVELTTNSGDLYVSIVQSEDNILDGKKIKITNADGYNGPANLYLTVVDNHEPDYLPCNLALLELTIDLPNTHVVLSAAAEEEIGAINTITSLNTLVLGEKITVGSVAIQENGGGLTVDGKITGTLSVPDKAAKTQEEPEKVWVKINETARVTTISVGEVNCNLYIAGNVGTVITSAARTTIDGNIATALTANASAEVVVTSNGSVAGAITANGQSEVYIVEGADIEDAALYDYTTTFGENTGSIVHTDEPEAEVNGVEYMTFAKALAMVPTNGVKTTVKLLSDVALEEGFTVAATQNMVLDLNGKTLSCDVEKNVSNSLITNRGTLVIKDSDDTNHDGSGDGLLRYSNATPEQSQYFSNVVTNNGDLTIESGHLHNTSTGGSAAYAVDNISNGTTCTPTFIMNGGKLDNEYSDAIRLFLNSTTNLNKVVINGGIINSKKASGRVIVMQDSNAYASKGELDITGGTINGKVNAWNAGNQPTEEFTAEQYAAISINISGGYIKQLNFTNEMSDATLRASTLKVTGGYYNVNPDIDPEKPQVSAGYRVVESGNADFPFKVELTPAAKIGTTEYATLAEAIAAANDAGNVTITLLCDYDFEANEPGYGWTTAYLAEGETATRNNMLEISGNNITFELAGHTISNLFNNTFKVSGTNVTFQNGEMRVGQLYYSDAAGTKIYTSENDKTCSYIMLVAGATNFIVNNLTTYGGINVCEGSTATINDLSFSGTKFYAVCSQENSTVTLNGGTYTKAITGATGHLFWIEAGSNMNITGGTFIKGNAAFRNGNVNPVITGGTFDFDPTNFGVAAGYEAVEENSLWTVQKAKEAKIGETEYLTLTAAFDAVEAGQTITLLTNIDLPATIAVTKQVTLDLNGKTISNTADLWVGNNWSFFSVKASGNLTVTGNGTIDAKANDCYTFDVQDGGTLTIENGTFTGNISCVYLINQANTGVSTCNIEGGTFSIKQLAPNVTEDKYRFLLNCLDASYQNNAARFNVTGGSFVNFNPANNLAEGAATNFCAAGYTATQTGDVWTVSQAMVAQVNGVEYATLAEAFAAVPASGATTITMIGNTSFNFSTPYFYQIAAEQNITLDLNGHEIITSTDYTGAQTAGNASSQLFKNYGTLTIIDNSTGHNGSLTHGANPAWQWDEVTYDFHGSYFSNVISNYGTVNVNSGTIRNASNGYASYVIDAFQDAKTYINGGNVVATKTALRQFTGTAANLLQINGGVIDAGRFGVAIHTNIGSSSKFEMTGGTVNGEYGVSVYCNNKVPASPELTISGGNMNAVVYVDGHFPASGITVSGGQIDSFFSEDADCRPITGGTFAHDPSQATDPDNGIQGIHNHVAPGYVANQSGNTWTVAPMPNWIDYAASDADFAAATNGTEISISSAALLAKFAKNVNDGVSTYNGYTIKLTANIDLAGKNWTPVGVNVSNGNKPHKKTFEGTFDGNNHTISNLYCYSTEDKPLGLFGYSYGGPSYIQNLTLSNVFVNGVHQVGAIIGNSNNVHIDNCTVSGGSVTTTPRLTNAGYDDGNQAGGIAGYFFSGDWHATGQVTNCTVENLTIKAYRDVGGIAGCSQNSSDGSSVSITGNTVKNCTIIADQTIDYVETKDFNANEIVGRHLSGTVESNTYTNVTVQRIAHQQ